LFPCQQNKPNKNAARSNSVGLPVFSLFEFIRYLASVTLPLH
jgi:hypothetical protein